MALGYGCPIRNLGLFRVSSIAILQRHAGITVRSPNKKGIRTMSRMLLAAAISVICVPLAFAQTTPTRVDTTQLPSASPTPTPATGTTRVAVINLGYVLNKYERASSLKDELQAEVKKMSEEAKRLQEMLNVARSPSKSDFKNGSKEEYKEKLIAGRRRGPQSTGPGQARQGDAIAAHDAVVGHSHRREGL